MSGPITWRNVNGRSDSAAAALLGQASESINNAFSSFDTALDTAIAGRKAEYDHTVKTNTDAFLNEMAKYLSPEALEAARPDLESMLTGFNGDVNTAQTRGAIDRGIADLRSLVTATDTYNLNQRKKAEAPDTAIAKNLQGREAWDELRVHLDNVDLLDESPFEAAMAKGLRAAEDRQELLRQRDRNRKIQEKEDIKTGRLDDIELSVAKVGDDKDTAAVTKAATIANLLAPYGINNIEDLDKLSPDKQLEVANKYKALNISPTSNTQLVDQAVNDFRSRNPEARGSELSALRQKLNLALTEREQLHSSDTATHNNQRQLIAQAAGTTLEDLESVKVQQNPESVVATILNENKDLFAEIGGGDTKTVSKLFTEVLAKGVTLLDKDNKPIQVKPTPDTLRVLAKAITPRWYYDSLVDKSDITTLINDIGLKDRLIKQEQAKMQLKELDASASRKYRGNDPSELVKNLDTVLRGYLKK